MTKQEVKEEGKQYTSPPEVRAAHAPPPDAGGTRADDGRHPPGGRGRHQPDALRGRARLRRQPSPLRSSWPRARTSSRCRSAGSQPRTTCRSCPTRRLRVRCTRSVEIGQMIPAELYAAVAQVLAFVYRMAGRRRAAVMNQDTIKKLLKHSDLLAAVGVVVVVTMLVVPLPPMILDLFITVNISAALAVAVATMYLNTAAGLLGVPEPPAADDDVPPGDQRLGDAPDPHQGRRRQRRKGLRPVRRRRQRRGRPRDLPDPGRDPVRGRHQRRRPRRRGRRAVHPGRDAR